MIKPLIPILIASACSLGSAAAQPVAPTDHAVSDSDVDSDVAFSSPEALLKAIAEHDRGIHSLTGTIRYTVINALENDRQQRLGKLAILDSEPPEADEISEPGEEDEKKNQSATAPRKYAVSFDTLLIDQRQEAIQEHYIFDGRWFVERLPEEKQFNKRELVPAGQTLDPMELMRDAPFWVSLGRDQDRLLASYDAQLLPTTDGLVDNPDFPELRFFADLPHVAGTDQLKLTPKSGSGFEDDWEWVRIWINRDTLLPALYIKSEWTGDLQIVELFSIKANTEIPSGVFDTTAPDERSGWRVQISPWRGQN